MNAYAEINDWAMRESQTMFSLDFAYPDLVGWASRERDYTSRMGEGGIRQFVRSELIAVPNGTIYPEYGGGEIKGPLHGQPANNWYLHLFYSDGTVEIIKPLGER